jgi:hypothetical protein
MCSEGVSETSDLEPVLLGEESVRIRNGLDVKRRKISPLKFISHLDSGQHPRLKTVFNSPTRVIVLMLLVGSVPIKQLLHLLFFWDCGTQPRTALRTASKVAWNIFRRSSIYAFAASFDSKGSWPLRALNGRARDKVVAGRPHRVLSRVQVIDHAIVPVQR